MALGGGGGGSPELVHGMGCGFRGAEFICCIISIIRLVQSSLSMFLNVIIVPARPTYVEYCFLDHFEGFGANVVVTFKLHVVSFLC